MVAADRGLQVLDAERERRAKPILASWSWKMACAIGAGVPWRGRRTNRGIVVYIVAESSRPYIENRVAALMRQSPELGAAEFSSSRSAWI